MGSENKTKKFKRIKTLLIFIGITGLILVLYSLALKYYINSVENLDSSVGYSISGDIFYTGGMHSALDKRSIPNKASIEDFYIQDDDGDVYSLNLDSIDIIYVDLNCIPKTIMPSIYEFSSIISPNNRAMQYIGMNHGIKGVVSYTKYVNTLIITEINDDISLRLRWTCD